MSRQVDALGSGSPDGAARPEPEQHGLSRRAAWALSITATLTMAVSYFDRQTLAVIAPTVTAQLAISERQYGWMISAFSLAYLVGAPLAGRLIDRVGARRGLLGAVVIWSAVAALHALAPGFGALFALRIALGLAEAPSFPGAAQAVQRALPPADRARGFGVLFTGSSLGAMLAPQIAPRLAARWSFRIAFVGTALLGLLWIPGWLAVAYAPKARAALDAGLRTSPDAADRAAERPSVLEVLRHPAVLRAVVAVLAAAPIMNLLLNWGAKYLVRDHGLTQAGVGHYLWMPPALYDLGAVLFGHLASQRAPGDGSPPRRLFAAAAALAASGALMPLCPGPLSATLLSGCVMGGVAGAFALITADMLARVSPRVVSTAGGMTAAAQSLAYIIAGLVIGESVERTHSYTAILIGLGLWVIPGAAIWLMWTPPPPFREGGSSGPQGTSATS